MQTMVSTAGGLPPAPPAPDTLTTGAHAGPWVVERELGRGGMGAVYAVVHQDIGKRAALKVVHGRLVSSICADRMLLEAKVVNAVGHPNIVDIFETGKLPDGRPYIVMERLEGQSLAFRADEGKLLSDLVIRILIQICDALIAAHAAGVIHRDLKLDNVFLVDNPEDPSSPRVKLLDWGIAKMITHEVKHTVDGQLVGTPQYLAPEQARGAPVTQKSDIYSLGVMAYEMFLEQLPFEAETAAEIMAMHLRATPPLPSELWPDIPPALEALLLAMLAKSPDLRPTALEVARRLEAIGTELQTRRTIIGGSNLATGSATAIPRLTRLRSEAGLAPTQPAALLSGWREGRLQYVIGGIAVVASVLLLMFTRAHDSRAATTDSISRPGQVQRAIVDQPVALQNEASVPEVAPAPPVIEPTSVTDKPRVKATRPSSSRKSPVTPRRGSKADPDGTLDVYR